LIRRRWGYFFALSLPVGNIDVSTNTASFTECLSSACNVYAPLSGPPGSSPASIAAPHTCVSSCGPPPGFPRSHCMTGPHARAPKSRPHQPRERSPRQSRLPSPHAIGAAFDLQGPHQRRHGPVGIT
jgi:hypothetical protein